MLAQQAADAAGQEISLWQMAMPFALIALLYYTMFVLPQKGRDKRLEELATGLKVNDHVVTTSGIYGVVTNVQRDANRVTLRVDDATGTKIRMRIDAISGVTGEKESADGGNNTNNGK